MNEEEIWLATTPTTIRHTTQMKFPDTARLSRPRANDSRAHRRMKISLPRPKHFINFKAKSSERREMWERNGRKNWLCRAQLSSDCLSQHSNEHEKNISKKNARRELLERKFFFVFCTLEVLSWWWAHDETMNECWIFSIQISENKRVGRFSAVDFPAGGHDQTPSWR